MGMSHFTEYEIRPFCDQLKLQFQNFFFGYNPGEWKSCSPYNRLICILENHADSSFSDQAETVLLVPNAVVLVPAFHEITHRQSDSMLHLSIHFSLELFYKIDLLNRYGRLYYEINPLQINLIRKMLEEPSRFMLTSAMRAVCWNFLANFAANTNFSVDKLHQGYLRYSNLIDYLQHHCFAGITVSQMADIMRMNKESFIKKFTYDTGTSPKLFFNRLLSEQAARLLAGSDMTIREIADELQFCNEFYFSRFIKRNLGMSPREYRLHNRTSV